MNIAFIPVRGGSKGIPGKNIKLFSGMPLVYWTLSELQKTDLIHKIILATDCESIKKTVNSFCLNKVEIFDRSEENSKDQSSTESVILEYLTKSNIDKENNFMLVQATSPLTTSENFSEAMHQYTSGKYDSILSCARIKRFFWSENGVPENYDFNNRPRRQDFKGSLIENGAIYINKVENILKNHNRISGNIGVYEMPEYTSVEIDEDEDWIIAESLMRKYVLKNDSLSPKIKLFVTDVDGVMTDAGMYYSENGDELKKFNTHDGMAFQILREKGIKTAIITSEETSIVKRRAKKLKVDYLFQGKKHNGKLEAVKKICVIEGIKLKNVVYIGDDINCFELLSSVGFPACPYDALDEIKSIPNIKILNKKGGKGVLREYVNFLIYNQLITR